MNNCKVIVKNKQGIIFLLLVFLCFLFYIRDLHEYDIGKMIIVLPIIFTCLFASKENLYYLIALLLPLGWGVSVAYIYPIIVILLYLRKNGPVVRCLTIAVFIGLYEILHYLVYPLPGGRFEPSVISTLVCVTFFTSYLIFNNNEVCNKDKFVLFFCIGTAVFLVFILLHSVKLYGLLGVLSGVYRLGDSGITNEMEETDIIFFRANANYVSYYSSACITFVMILLRRKTIPLVLASVLLIVYLCAGFSTQSRTWFLTVVLFFICFAFSFKRYRTIALMGVALFGVIVIYIALKFDDIIEAYLTRFSFDDPNSTMAEYGGRPELIKLFNDYLASHIDALIWGVGVNGQPLICKVDNGATKGFRAPHNAIQQIIVCYGLIGLYFYIVPFFKRIAKLYKKYRPGFIYILPLIIVMIILQTIQILYPPLLMAPLIPAVYLFTIKNNNAQ